MNADSDGTERMYSPNSFLRRRQCLPIVLMDITASVCRCFSVGLDQNQKVAGSPNFSEEPATLRRVDC